MVQKPDPPSVPTVVVVAPPRPADVHVDSTPARDNGVAVPSSAGSPGEGAASAMRITTDVDCGVAVISVAGELVMDTAGELRAAITAVVSAGPVTRIVVDLVGVSFLDMAGLSVLLQSRDAAVQAGASFRAIRPQRLVRQVLHLTGTCLLLTAASASVNGDVHAVRS